MKSAIWYVFSIITVLIVSLIAWTVVIGVFESGYNSPSMFNNYSTFKEYVWYSLESSYADRYAAYTERAGLDYYLRTSESWDGITNNEANSVTVEHGTVRVN